MSYDGESRMNTSGLNGNGRAVANIANHALLVLVSRAMAAFGVPVALFLFAQMWHGIQDIQEAAQLNAQGIAVHEVRLDQHGRRLGALED